MKKNKTNDTERDTQRQMKRRQSSTGVAKVGWRPRPATFREHSSCYTGPLKDSILMSTHFYNKLFQDDLTPKT